MVLPGVIAVAMPPLVGFGLGAQALGGMLGGALLADAEAPAIARATAASLMPAYLTPSLLPAIEAALEDADPLVRRAALAALEAVDVRTRLGLGSPLLDDPVKG